MISYTVAKFRKHLREAFSRADDGEEVYIVRHDRSFQLKPAGKAIRLSAGKNASESSASTERNESGKPNSCNCPAFAVPHSHLSDDGKSHNIRPDVPMIEAKGAKVKYPKSGIDNPFTGEEAPELQVPACCKKKNPCKHWQYDDQQQVWINSITGEKREVTT